MVTNVHKYRRTFAAASYDSKLAQQVHELSESSFQRRQGWLFLSGAVRNIQYQELLQQVNVSIAQNKYSIHTLWVMA